MKNESGELEVRFGERPHWIVVQDQGVSDVVWPGVTPHDACDRFVGVDPHPSRDNAKSVA